MSPPQKRAYWRAILAASGEMEPRALAVAPLCLSRQNQQSVLSEA